MAASRLDGGVLRQFVIGRGDGETDRGVDPLDLPDGLQVAQLQVALGQDVHGKAVAGDDFQRLPGLVTGGFQR